MASVSKRLATDETLMLLVDAVNNTETVKQAKAEIQAEGTAQVNNVKSTAEEMVKDINQVPKNTSDIAELNSNLTQLEYSDVAGGKNYWSLGNTTAISTGYAWENKPLNLPSGRYTFSAYSDMAYELLLYDASGNKLLSLANTELNKRWNKTFTISSNIVSASLYVHAGTIKDIQIEEGTTATDYEPYIPSVKMLAEDVKEQNDSLGNLNILGNAIIGKRWNSLYDANRAQFKVKVNPNETYTIKIFDNPNNLSLYGFQSDNDIDGEISGTDIIADTTGLIKITTKSNCKYLLLNITHSSTMTSDLANSFKAMVVKGGTEPTEYNGFSGDNGVVASDLADINNAIDDLKNDLSWKLLADNVAVGTNTNIVSGAREYYIVAKYGTINITTLIPSIVLGKTIFDGYYASASDNARIQINTTTSALNLVSFIYGGSVKDDATYSVYYR